MSPQLHYLIITVQFIQVTLGARPLCFECKDIPSPQTCQYATQCGEHEECSVESVVTSGGLVLFNVGCKPKTICMQIKRDLFSIQDDPSTDMITCMECCTNGDFCNRQGCGTTDVPRSRRGPYCFTCDVQSNTTTCRKVTICGPDDVCVLEPNHMFPQNTFYTSRCGHESTCPASGTHHHMSTCPICCDSDFCNNHCNHTNNYIVSAVTTMSSSTVRETASSGQTSLTVIENSTTFTTPTKTTSSGTSGLYNFSSNSMTIPTTEGLLDRSTNGITILTTTGLLNVSSNGTTVPATMAFISTSDSTIQFSPTSTDKAPSTTAHSIISTTEMYSSTVKHSEPINCKTCHFAPSIQNCVHSKQCESGCLYGIVLDNDGNSILWLDCFDYDKCTSLHQIAVTVGYVNHIGRTFTTINCCNDSDLCNDYTINSNILVG